MNRRDIALMDDGEVAALGEDLTTSAARTELREVAQLLDAELDADVSDTPFVVASDGGARR